MSLNVKYENMNNSNENIVPLGNSEIKSILKAQSEAVFIEEKKMISNKSEFIKKSLIDLALEFENKVTDIKSEDNNTKLEKKDIDEPSLETNNEDKNNALENSEIHEVLIEENISDKPILEENNTKENDESDNNHTNAPLQSNEIDTSKLSSSLDLEQNEKKIEETQEISEASLEKTQPEIEETKKALNSVRNAVSQSIKNSTEENDEDSLNQINQDIDHFKNIFSALSNLTEKVIHENIENKIIEIASELAGYQIDKMPDKYEKKIKTFLKSINRFEEKMSIETNDKDYEALLKIENFKSMNDTINFKPNSDISRGDIILNCDGMHYSEKTITNKSNTID
jgi:hypothetical protein|tara:strand:- start:1988 stop:3010 length:1023 start_codon:yes stop_codon:yes gene_type:complete